jgi:hypothetical protein
MTDKTIVRVEKGNEDVTVQRDVLDAELRDEKNYERTMAESG